jgi:hypothetical protein
MNALRMPSEAEIQAFDYGPEPTIDTSAPIVSHMEGVLKDPESARYRNFTEPQEYWIKTADGDYWTGHAVYFQVNAKNSYGGYTGWTQYLAGFSGNELWTCFEVDENLEYIPNTIRYEMSKK